MTINSGSMVSVRGLSKSFRAGVAEVKVLRGIDLDINKGEVLSVVGASGVGKSTLLHILGGLDRPASGSVEYAGRDIFRMAETELASFRNRNIGFVFQFHHLLPEFDALENVMMPMMINGVGRTEGEERARRLLSEVGLTGRLDHRPGELSGGEQQRVAIARALVMEPSVVLADEPTGNLDTHTAESVHDMLHDINRKKGVTFVIVTHNEGLAERADRVIRMVDGRIVDGV
ncbi:MAG: ABC transporter ATP-binding protein [Nitrospirae bacterium]|nr:ABC transporter ATP-binding protein [Nitrospirota bacterium]